MEKYAPAVSMQTPAKAIIVLFIVSVPITFESSDGVETRREQGEGRRPGLNLRNPCCSATRRCDDRRSEAGVPAIKQRVGLRFPPLQGEKYWIVCLQCTKRAMCVAGPPGTAAAHACCFNSFRKEECCSMQVHIDRKRLDGEAIAFVVIILLIVIAFTY
jgi:hypothetical protein